MTSSRRSRLAAACAALLAAAACATAGVGTRARAITDADSQAKRALESESQIDASRIPARSFAVLPFDVPAGDTLLAPLGAAMGDFLVSDLSHTRQLRLVERQHVDAIARELHLVDQGITDARTAPRVGRLVGARRILIGDVTTGTDGEVTFNARVVDVFAGTVEQVIEARAPLARIIDAEKALALRVFDRLGITLTPAERVAVELHQTNNLQAAVAYGKGVQAEERGDAASADRAFADAARIDVGFAAARAQVASAGAAPTASASQRVNSLARILDLTSQTINAPAPTQLPEAADAPLTTSQLLTLVITVIVR
jgi:TolB-like protein